MSKQFRCFKGYIEEYQIDGIWLYSIKILSNYLVIFSFVLGNPDFNVG